MNLDTSILLIEDEKNIVNFIHTALCAKGFHTAYASNGKEGLAMAEAFSPDLILLDLGLPDMDGIEIIKTLRLKSNIPIVVISARLQEEDKVTALELGADDYITKPFGTNELIARIRTALRHSRSQTADATVSPVTYSFNGLYVDLNKRLVILDNQMVHLTQIEYKILEILVENAGKVITYDTIMNRVWGPFTDDNNRILRVNMANIRRKLEKNPADPKYIFTELGIGYRLAEEI